MFQILSTRIEHFLQCAREVSLARAAQSIGISQPALTSSIKKLEEELGAKLFERSAKGIRLTLKGKALYDSLSDIQTNIYERIIPESLSQKKRVLRIGCVGHLASRYLLDVLDKTEDRLPIVHLFTSTSFECLKEVEIGNLDFAYVAWSNTPHRVESIRIAPEPVAFVGLKSKFSEIEKITDMKQLKKFPWVDLPKPQRDWTKFLDVTKKAYLARDIRILRDIIFRGLAIGYVQLNIFTKDELEKLAISPAPGFYKDAAIYAVHDSQISDESKDLMNLLNQEFRLAAKLSSNL